MGGSPRVLRRGRTGGLLGEVSREPLVEALDRDVEGCAQSFHETFGLLGLLSVVAGEGERQPDDDPVDVLRCDELADARQAVVARGTLDDGDRPGDRAGRVRDCDARPRRAEVQRQDLQSSTEASCRLPTS